MKRLLLVCCLFGASFAVSACGAAATSIPAQQEATDVPTDAGSSEEPMADGAETPDAAATDAPAGAVDTTGVLLGNPLLARLPDAEALTQFPSDNSPIVNGPLTSLYQSDMSLEDGKNAIETMYTEAGYTFDPPAHEKPGVYQYTLVSPNDIVDGAKKAFCIGMLMKGQDATEIALMKTEKLIVYYTCSK